MKECQRWFGQQALSRVFEAAPPTASGRRQWSPSKLFAPCDHGPEHAHHLPTDEIAMAADGSWEYGRPRPLPPALINNAVTGWDGAATIHQPGLGIDIGITAQAPLGTAIVHSPGAMPISSASSRSATQGQSDHG